MNNLKWTVKGNKEIIYQGTLKDMTLFSGQARLEEHGVLYAEGECREGIKIGFWIHYHTNGQVMSRESYDTRGVKQGLSELFYEDGTPWSTTTYKDGRPIGEVLRYYEDGKLKSRSSYDDKGLQLACQEFYPNGHLRLEQTFVNGRLSKERRYQQDGSLW